MKRKKIPRAGFIPYYKEDDKVYVLLMRPTDSKYGGNEFQLAKGKIDAGEDSETAAFREAHEELGLKKSNVISHSYLGLFLGYTDVYYGEIKDKNDFDPTTFETEETKWMTVDKFLSVGRGIHKPIFKAFIRAIGEEK